MDFIPPNKGQYEVGCTDFMTTSSFNLDIDDVSQNLQSGSQNEKEIPGYFMRLYYPTPKESANTHERAKWIPKGLYADGFLDFVHLPTFVLGRIARWLMGKYICQPDSLMNIFPVVAKPEICVYMFLSKAKTHSLL